MVSLLVRSLLARYAYLSNSRISHEFLSLATLARYASAYPLMSTKKMFKGETHYENRYSAQAALSSENVAR